MTPYDWRFYLNWTGRLSRSQYMIGSQILGVAAVFVIGLAMISLFVAPRASTYLIWIFFVLALIPSSSLAARRAHDLGWSMLLPIGVTLPFLVLLTAAWLNVMPSELRAPPILIALLPASAVSLMLSFKKGKAEPNKYGPPPEEAA